MKTESAVVRESTSPCMDKLDRVDWTTGDWFQIGDYRFGVRTTSAAFGEWVRYVLGAFPADGPDEPGKDPLFSIVVEDEHSAPARAGKRLQILYEGTADIVRTMDVQAIARSFLHELEAITFPTRDDALYVETSVIQGEAGTLLIPWMLVPPINEAARQIRRSVDLVLPGTVSVAIDPASGHLVPVTPTLGLPADAMDALAGAVPVRGDEDVRALIREDTPIDRVIVLGGERWEPLLRPAVSRASALFKLGSAVRNAGALKGRALETLADLVATTETLETRWTSRSDLTDVIEAAVGGRLYEPEGVLV